MSRTKGPITKTLLWFALPMTLGNLLQQFYNIADTLIIGRFVGPGQQLWTGGADGGFLGPSGCSGLWAVGSPLHWCDWYLGVHPDWMADRGYYGRDPDVEVLPECLWKDRIRGGNVIWP